MTTYRTGRASAESKAMDERIAEVVRGNSGPAPVTVRHVDPATLANGNGHAPVALANGHRKHVTKDEVAPAIAGLSSDFTCGEVADTVGLSQSAAKQHVQRLAQDGVVQKTGAVRENGAHVWRLSGNDAEGAAETWLRAVSGARRPGDAESGHGYVRALRARRRAYFASRV